MSKDELSRALRAAQDACELHVFSQLERTNQDGTPLYTAWVLCKPKLERSKFGSVYRDGSWRASSSPEIFASVCEYDALYEAMAEVCSAAWIPEHVRKRLICLRDLYEAKSLECVLEVHQEE